MPQALSCRISDVLMEWVQAEEQRRKCTRTEVIEMALKDYFARDHKQTNMALLMSKLDDLEFEAVKARAVMLRCFDMMGQELSDELLAEAEKDARAYLEKRKKNG